MVLSITAFCLRILRKFNIPRNSCNFVLLDGGSSFWIGSMQGFNEIIVFFSLIWPRNFTGDRKKVIYRGCFHDFVK